MSSEPSSSAAIPAGGRLSGLHAALSAPRAPIVAAVACDMPFVSAALLRYMLSLAHGPERPGVVVPRTSGGYHPITRRLADGRLRADGLFEEMKLRVVARDALAPFGDPNRLLANLNTPLEYRAIEAKGIQS